MSATDLAMDLRMNFGNLSRDISGAKNVLRNFAGGFRDIGAVGSRGLAAIGAAVSLSVREFAKADHAAQDLKSALAATGNEVDGNFASMTAFAKATRDQTIYSADFVQQLQALSLNLGISAKQTNTVVEAGIGLGERYFGGDAQRGVKAASLAVLGNMRELQRLIPAIKSAHGEQAKLDMVNRVAAAGFEEAKTKATTFSGSISSLGRSYHEAGAAIGSAFAPEIMKLATLVSAVSEKIAGMTDEQKAALVTQVELAAGLSVGAVALGKVGTVLTGLRAVFAGTLPLVGAAGIALGGIGALLVNLIGKGDTFGERLVDVWGRIKNAAVAAGSFIAKTWEQYTDAIVLMYYQMQETFGGGEALGMFEKYRKDIAAAEKQAQKERTDAAAAGTGKRSKMEDESVKHAKGSISSIAEYHKKIQNAILAGDDEEAKKKGLMKDPGKAGQDFGKAAANELKKVFTDAKAGVAGGEGHPIVEAAKKANGDAMARASRAEMRDLNSQEDTLTRSLSTNAGPENSAYVERRKKQIEARRAQLRGIIGDDTGDEPSAKSGAKSLRDPYEEAMAAAANLANLRRQRDELLAERAGISKRDEHGNVVSDNATRDQQIQAELKRNATAQAKAQGQRYRGYNAASAADGEDRVTAGMNPIKLAANIARAKKELADVEKQIENVSKVDVDSMDDSRQGEASALKQSNLKQLEAKKRKLEAYVYRGGRAAPDQPFGDRLEDDAQRMRDQDATGPRSLHREQMERENDALRAAAKADPAMSKFVETPGSKMAGTITQQDAKRLAEAAILLKSAAEDFKNAPKVGVVRDNQ